MTIGHALAASEASYVVFHACCIVGHSPVTAAKVTAADGNDTVSGPGLGFSRDGDAVRCAWCPGRPPVGATALRSLTTAYNSVRARKTAHRR
jgi:hypothetical protein